MIIYTLEDFIRSVPHNNTLKRHMLFEWAEAGKISRAEFCRILDFLSVSDFEGENRAKEYVRQGRL